MPSGPSERPIHIDDKIASQLAIRGWTEQEVREAGAGPPIGTSTDHTEGRADPATVYGSKSGGYVVVSDITRRVGQVSDRTDPGWVPDSRIVWKRGIMVAKNQKLYGRPKDFFELNGNAVMKLSRGAAIEVCLRAASQGLILVKIEGGIWRDGTFEARLDAIWDGEDPPITKNEADRNNVRAAAFIKSTDSAYNAFIVTSASIRGYAHRTPVGMSGK